MERKLRDQFGNGARLEVRAQKCFDGINVNVISDKFRGMTHDERDELIWNWLGEDLRKSERRKVWPLLLLTPREERKLAWALYPKDD
jgi:stress-induced morphogen